MTDQPTNLSPAPPVAEEDLNPTQLRKAPDTGGKKADEVNPRCPHCGADPLRFNFRIFKHQAPEGMGLFQTIIFFCAEPKCSKTLNMQVLGQEAPGVVGARNIPKGLIQLAH